MRWASDAELEAKVDRLIIGGNIDRDPVGRQLTPEAREEAIAAGIDAWRAARIGNGDAAQIGIQRATGKVLKR